MSPSGVLLRLDDGSLIGPAATLGGSGNGAIRISVQRSSELGRASQADIDRLQRIIDRLGKEGVPVAQPAPVLQHQPTASKRQRADSFVGGHQQHQQLPYAGDHGWLNKCAEVLRAIGVELGQSKPAFWDRLDPNLYAHYYKQIVKPIFLGEIERKIQMRGYHSPQDFAADMRLHWHNVKSFNLKGDFYHNLGTRVEGVFEELWAKTGYSTERNKRATAGHAATKFDSEKYDGPSKSKLARSQGGNKRHGRANGASHADAPISEERKQQMVTFLSDMPDEHNAGFMALLPPEMTTGLESGELELDFYNLDLQTLRRIDQWLKTIRPDLVVEGEAPDSPAPMSNNHSVMVESFSDDEDYAGETEEDSD